MNNEDIFLLKYFCIFPIFLNFMANSFKTVWYKMHVHTLALHTHLMQIDRQA